MIKRKAIAAIVLSLMVIAHEVTKANNYTLVTADQEKIQVTRLPLKEGAFERGKHSFSTKLTPFIFLRNGLVVGPLALLSSPLLIFVFLQMVLLGNTSWIGV